MEDFVGTGGTQLLKEGEGMKKKGLFIIGGEGEGKTERARVEAAKLGGHVFGTFIVLPNKGEEV